MRALRLIHAMGMALAVAQAADGSNREPSPPRLWGPLFSDVSLTLVPGAGIEAAGPLWATRETDGVHTTRLSPLWAHETEPQLEREEWDILYPLISYDRFGTEHRLQIAQLLQFNGGTTVEGEVKQRQTLFPFYFRQKSSGGTNDYLAVLPFYGHLQNHLFRDKVRFVAAPLYVESEKRGVTTRNYLFPFFSLRSGGGVSGYQLWPIVGSETKTPTTRTNSLDELEVVPGHRRDFILWPFLLSENADIGGTNPTTNRFAAPFYLRTRSPETDFTWWFGFSSRTNRVAQFQEWGYPWPILGRARGPGRHSNRFFPIWGRATNASMTSDFVAWPAYSHKLTRAGTLERERTRLLYFGWSDLREEDTASGRAFRRRDLWPLFTWRRDFEGRQQLRILAPVEPVLPANKGIDRLHAPLWSLWRSDFDPTRQRRSQSLLWNLWRRDQVGTTSNTSAFFGLVQTHRTDKGRTWRVGVGPWGIGPRPPALPPRSPSAALKVPSENRSLVPLRTPAPAGSGTSSAIRH